MSVFDRLSTTRAISTITSAESAEDQGVSQAVEKLKQIGPSSLPKLLETLAYNSGRIDVLQDVLASMLSDETLPAFRRALFHKKPEVVERVAEVLRRRGRYDPNQLTDLLLDPEAPKATVADILAAHGSAVDARALLGMLSEVPPDSRPVLLNLLQRVASPKLVPSLIRRLETADPRTREGLVRTLGRFSTAEVQETLAKRMLEDEHKNVRLAALEALIGLDMPPPLEALIKMLADADLIIQGRVLDALAELENPKLTAHAVALLDNDSPSVRRAAVEVLNRRPDANAVKALAAALDDEDWWFRERAADALVAIGGPRVLHAAMTRFVDDDPALHDSLVRLIGRLEGIEDDLRGFLEHRSAPLRRGAIRALAAIGDREVVPALLPMLEPASEADTEAVRALSALGDPRAIQPLLAQLETSEDGARQQLLLEALEAVTDRANAPYVIQQVRRIGARGAAETIDPPAEKTLQSLCLRFDHKLPVGDDEAEAPMMPPMMSDAPSVVGERVADPGPPSQAVPAAGAAPAGAGAGKEAETAKPQRDTVVDLSVAGEALNPLALRAGDRLGDRYRIIRQIGRGGFGIVVLVEDEIITEQMILKFLAPHVATDDVVVHRFKHEIRYARRITHENVIRIHDLISFGETFAISMEYFDSHSLVAELHRYKRIPQARGRDILIQVARGLGAAHRENVIHRDLKPGNVLIDDELKVKIVDFGLAAAASQGASRLTRSGLVIGTPIYMAPEQIEGGEIDGRTDIYSLGVLMYEMFTGTVPFEGENAMATLFKHLHGEAQRPREREPEMDEALEAIILKAMARDPANRFQDTAELCVALEKLPG